MWLWFFHVSLFSRWCSHVCDGYIVHTFPSLCHFLCVDIRTGRTNTTKLKGAQSRLFLKVSKTMSLNIRLLLFLLLHSSSISWSSRVLLSCSPSSFLLCKNIRGLRSELNWHLTLINAFSNKQGHKPWLVILLSCYPLSFSYVQKLKPSWLSCGFGSLLYFLMCKKLNLLEWWRLKNSHCHRTFNLRWRNPPIPPCGLNQSYVLWVLCQNSRVE